MSGSRAKQRCWGISVGSWGSHSSTWTESDKEEEERVRSYSRVEVQQDSPERRRTRQPRRGSARHHGHRRNPAGCTADSFPGTLLESPREVGRESGPDIHSHRALAGHTGPSGDRPVLTLHAGSRKKCCVCWTCGESRAETQCHT